LPREQGHRAGAKAFQTVAQYCEKLGLQAMTVYAFSTENWKRPAREVEAIMDLLEEYIDSCEKELKDHSVQFHFIGDRTPLRPALKAKMDRLEEITRNNRMILNIAVNYGARAELCRALETLKSEERAISEQSISEALYTAHSGDPDMIVRTGGDLRISNFLLWQAAYAELYFTDKLWPDFGPSDVDAAIFEFYSRQRRYGGV
jgi:undecaprenyl diphosphate synthase